MSLPAATEPATRSARCWSEIGVWGNHSCPELQAWTHCHNCPVFSQAGRRLFERRPPEDYLEEWTQLVAGERSEEMKTQHSVMVFRLGEEWLALETRRFREVAEKRVIHRIPHRTNKVLLGLANIRGGLQLCVSLRELLGIAESGPGPGRVPPKDAEKMAVLENEGGCWVCLLDEILGIHRFLAEKLQPVPVTVAKAAASFTRGIFQLENKRIGYLDDELLLYHLKRSLL